MNTVSNFSPSQPSAPTFYNVAETAELLRLDQSTMYRHLRSGKFPAVKIGGRYVVPRVVVERLIAEVLAAGRCVDVADWSDAWRSGAVGGAA
ncbi:helix-turn-helix domain-containing protein [Amycolatopsis alkalitolerans]|uniref:Helix-turn-helix domain-containing protein n=1 Tax=Amycolatopsis alkalitolerans TaxID=2547244 RepID=A0A5C4LT47_9PSEU|nr:helix-turn-helix domain-containing protein [Amycolatopsis alkalitolerans]TNC20891.1 helix-turn-helix domain-containing protein [Amycolatopsis alkalitolerans]